jgi:hypothetical protein
MKLYGKRAAGNSRSWARRRRPKEEVEEKERRHHIKKYEYKNRERKFLSYLYFLERKMTGENMKEEATRHTTALWRVYRGWMFVSPIAF